MQYESLAADLYDLIAYIKPNTLDSLLPLYYSSAVPSSYPAQVVNSYLNSVETHVVSAIQRIYALDFELFGYAFR